MSVFEQMRLSLHARLEELNHLLFVSQSVASSLEVEDAVKPVLEAMLATGASCVRVVLKPGTMIHDTPEEIVREVGRKLSKLDMAPREPGDASDE